MPAAADSSAAASAWPPACERTPGPPAACVVLPQGLQPAPSIRPDQLTCQRSMKGWLPRQNSLHFAAM